jgi:hypothetical protein
MRRYIEIYSVASRDKFQTELLLEMTVGVRSFYPSNRLLQYRAITFKRA